LTETKESADRGVVLLRKLKPYQKDKLDTRKNLSESFDLCFTYRMEEQS